MNYDKASGFFRDDLIYSEHPDPAWARRSWSSLDGTWQLEHRGVVKEIRVPFPIGSEASGVDFGDSGRFVYRRNLSLPGWRKDRTYLLRVGASDYGTVVKVNGVRVGSHVGGYSSFTIDISQALHAGDNAIELVVTDSHSAFQARGKQTFFGKPFAVWYSGTAGLWQPIWIEETGRVHLERAELRPDFAARRIDVAAAVAARKGDGGDVRDLGHTLGLGLKVRSPDGSEKSFDAGTPGPDGLFRLSIAFDDIPEAYWSGESPELHAVEFTLRRDGETLDRVESYFGLREVRVDKDGFLINGERTFLRMVLVQGYYPGGVYTPLSYERIAEDIKAIKAMGYNGARIHEKVESPYFHFLCDRLGLLTSFEMPSFYLPSKKGFKAWEGEFRELVARDKAHPSCIMRMLFNETWGIWGVYGRNSKTRRFVLAMCDLARELDPSRPVIDNSGWEHLRTDVADFHHYLRNASMARTFYEGMKAGRKELLSGFSVKGAIDFYIKDQVTTATRSLFLDGASVDRALPLFLSEYGGFGWYDTENKSAVLESLEEYTRDIIESGLFCGFCYTQLYDVGAEVNGLLDSDRKPKVDAGRVRAANLGGKA